MTIFKTLLSGTAALGLSAAAFAQGTTAPATAAPAAAPAASTTPAATPAATPATTGSKVTAGATVMDTAGGQVGTIKTVDATGAVVSTGAHEVKLPLTSFANGPNGPVISMTKAQLDQAAGQAAEGAKANLPSQLTVGSTIKDQQGGDVGKVEANDGQFVTVATAKNKVKLPMNAFASTANGAIIGMTAAQLDAAATQAKPAGGR